MLNHMLIFIVFSKLKGELNKVLYYCRNPFIVTCFSVNNVFLTGKGILKVDNVNLKLPVDITFSKLTVKPLITS